MEQHTYPLSAVSVSIHDGLVDLDLLHITHTTFIRKLSPDREGMEIMGAFVLGGDGTQMFKDSRRYTERSLGCKEFRGVRRRE